MSDIPQGDIASNELSHTTESTVENTPRESVKASATNSPASSQSASSIQLLIQGMTCASCVSSVEKALQSVTGVDKARVNLAEQSALVLTSLANSEIEQPLLQAVREAGYQGEIVEDLASTQKKQQQALQQHQALQKRNTIWALAMGAPLMLWGVLGGSMTIQNSTDQLAWGVVGLLCLWLLSTAGRAFYSNAYQALKHKRATMDTLVALGTGAAWLYSMLVVIMPSWFPEASRHVYFEASAMIVGLISLGHFIEAKAKSENQSILTGIDELAASSRNGHCRWPGRHTFC